MALTQTFNQDTLGNIGTAAAVSTAAPAYTTGTTASLSLTTAGLLRVDGSGVTQPISASTLPLPTGASTSALQITGNTSLAAISGQLPATLGQKTSANSLAVVIASDQSAVPVSGTVTVAQNYAQGATTAGELGPLVQGAATTASPTYTTATTNPLSLTLAGALRVDGSATTQPISAVTLPLPTGAATAALQTTGNTTLAAISGQLPASLGAKVSAASLSVVLASDEVVPISIAPSTTAALTSVTAATATSVILAVNANRKGYSVTNDSTAIMYLAFAATASTTAYSLKMFPNAVYVGDFVYTGAISAIWSAANGAARVTEFT